MRLLCTAITLLFSSATFAQQKPDATLLFNFGNTVLTEQSQQELPVLLRQLRDKLPAVITLRGYTDKKGSDELNDTLARSRVMNVVQLLKQTMPAGTKFQISSYGSNNLLTKEDERQGINRRVEITITEKMPAPKEEALTELVPYRQDVEEQLFVINLDDTVRITAKEGTYLEILPKSIQDKKGKLASGMAELRIKEYYDPAKIMLAGLNSASPQGLLQSGGMLSITLMQGPDTLSAATKRGVLLKMPAANGIYGDMNVYTLSHDVSNPLWNTTQQRFVFRNGYWDTPSSEMLEDVSYAADVVYNNLKIGGTYTDNFNTAGPLISFRRMDYSRTKRVIVHVTKKDSATIQINAKIKFSHRGFRKFGMRTLDTTYYVKFIRSEYSATVSMLNWLNCDRFYNTPNPVDIYVSTPGYRGMGMVTYFKTLNGFLPAYAGAKDFKVSGVPENLPVIMVAVGKKGDDFYFGKKELLTKQDGKFSVAMEKVTEDEFKDAIKRIQGGK